MRTCVWLALLTVTAHTLSPPLPYCTPLAPRRGTWRLDYPWGGDGPEPHQFWEPAPDEPACRFRVASEGEFLSCFRDKRIAVIGDSTGRNLLMCLAEFLGQCGSTVAQRLGPDDPAALRMCAEVFAAIRAHGDVTIVTPPALGNVTFAFHWAPMLSDVTRAASAALRAPPGSVGAPDATIMTAGLWTTKEAGRSGGVSSSHVNEFFDELPRLVSLVRDDLVPGGNPSLLQGRLLYAFAPYAEQGNGDGGGFPHVIVDALNGAAAAALGEGGLGIPVFNASWYTRMHPDDIRAAGGKITTWDGYHPAHAVVVTLMRDMLSHFCGLPSWEEAAGNEGGHATSRGSAGEVCAQVEGGTWLISPSTRGGRSTDETTLTLLLLALGVSCTCCIFCRQCSSRARKRSQALAASVR